MSAPLKLGIYALGVLALFFGAFGLAGLVVPEDVASDWAGDGIDMSGDGEDMSGHGDDMSGEENHTEADVPVTVTGLSLEQDGFLLEPVEAPRSVGESGELSFRIAGPDGSGVSDYVTSHEKDLHLIVVHSSGSPFRHVHPALGADGVWSMPWTWDRAGTYRIYADFVPAALGDDLTLSRTVDVAGELSIDSPRTPTEGAEVDGFEITVDGDLRVGADSMLTFSVSRDGQPVATLQPYLGAYGHLVALREGDLAYLHVHPMGEPGDGSTEPGPQIEFMTQVPTAGTYLLYLDFQVAGEVHTAQFTAVAEPTEHADPDGESSGHADSDVGPTEHDD